MIEDTFITDQRLRVLHEPPWPIPAGVLLSFVDEDLDNLAAAKDCDEYWSTLNDIVTRVRGGES